MHGTLQGTSTVFSQASQYKIETRKTEKEERQARLEKAKEEHSSVSFTHTVLGLCYDKIWRLVGFAKGITKKVSSEVSLKMKQVHLHIIHKTDLNHKL